MTIEAVARRERAVGGNFADGLSTRVAAVKRAERRP